MDHQHKLRLNSSGAPSYTCSGCKEIGFGSCYNCEKSSCNYILHKECAEPVKYAVHPFFKDCKFEFFEKAEEGGLCDACGKSLLGFFYFSKKPSFLFLYSRFTRTVYSLHPCCLNLEENILGNDGNVTMTLSHEVPSDCIRCKQRRVVKNNFKGWSYVVNSDGKTCVHVSCFKDMILENLNNKSKGKMRSFLKFTGKLAVNMLIDIATGDITNSISTIIEAFVSGFSE